MSFRKQIAVLVVVVVVIIAQGEQTHTHTHRESARRPLPTDSKAGSPQFVQSVSERTSGQFLSSISLFIHSIFFISFPSPSWLIITSSSFSKRQSTSIYHRQSDSSGHSKDHCSIDHQVDLKKKEKERKKKTGKKVCGDKAAALVFCF